MGNSLFLPGYMYICMYVCICKEEQEGEGEEEKELGGGGGKKAFWTRFYSISTNNTHSHASEKYRGLATMERVIRGLTNGPHLGGGGGLEQELQPAPRRVWVATKLSESRAAYSERVPWSVSESVRRLHLRTRSTDAEDKNRVLGPAGWTRMWLDVKRRCGVWWQRWGTKHGATRG